MADKYVCSKCKMSGAKKFVPYKVIYDDNGESVKFMAQLCERCFKEIFDTSKAPAQSTDEKIAEKKGEDFDESSKG